jgi:hypothetical protein
VCPLLQTSTIIIVKINAPYMNAIIASAHHCQFDSNIAASKSHPEGSHYFRQERRAAGGDFGLTRASASLETVRVLDRNDSHRLNFERGPRPERLRPTLGCL